MMKIVPERMGRQPQAIELFQFFSSFENVVSLVPFEQFSKYMITFHENLQRRPADFTCLKSS